MPLALVNARVVMKTLRCLCILAACLVPFILAVDPTDKNSKNSKEVVIRKNEQLSKRSWKDIFCCRNPRHSEAHQKNESSWSKYAILVTLAVAIFSGFAGFMMTRKEDIVVQVTETTSEILVESMRYVLLFQIARFFRKVLSLLELVTVVSSLNMKWRRSEAFMNQVYFAIYDICVATLLHLVINLVSSLPSDQEHTQVNIQSYLFLIELAAACLCIGKVARTFKESRMLRISELAIYLNIAITFTLPIILNFFDFHTAAVTLFGGSATIIITALMYPESDSPLPT